MSVIDKATPVVPLKNFHVSNGDDFGPVSVSGIAFSPLSPDDVEVQTVHAVAFRFDKSNMFWVPRHKLVRVIYPSGAATLACAVEYTVKLVPIQKQSHTKSDHEMVVIIKAEMSGKTGMGLRLRVEAGSNSTGMPEEIWFPAYQCTSLDEGFWAIKAQLAHDKGIQAHVG